MDSGEAQDEVRRDASQNAGAALEALARRAEAVLVFEGIWPPLAWAGALVALFLAVSWFGLWFAAPRVGRIAGLALFAALLAAALAPLARLKRPTRQEALARLDRDASTPHRPAASLADRLAMAGDDPTTGALWRLHRRRLARQVEAITPALPSPRMAQRDSHALRFAALLLALAAAIVAGPERHARVAAAFDWRGGSAAAAAQRLDAWIDPPAYTGKPPILLDVSPQAGPAQKLVAPEGSILVVRAEASAIEAHVEGALTPLAGDQKASGANAPIERRWTLRGDGALTLTRYGSPFAAFAIAAIAAGEPTITLIDPPRANLSGALTLHYALADRYGVASAEAEFSKPRGDGAGAPPRALIEAPKPALQLPSTASGVGEASTTSDLSEHPWAGAEVVMTLKATGLSGAVGSSAPIAISLPQRDFHNPIARALVEQRRDLILDPDHDRPRLAAAIAALLIAPDVFAPPAGVYLGLRAAQSRLAAARGDADLVAVADLLWAMAVQIEDGDASEAQRDLRAAEDKLREALQRGTGDEEIRELTKELRDAAERYMRDLASQAPNVDSEATPMEEQDLESLLDRFADAARNGAREDAEAMLDRLQNMFENMRSARQAEADPALREMRKQLGELEKLLRDQQALRDETFRRDQRERLRRDSGEDGAAPQANEGERAGEPTLEQRQRALRERLAEMQRRLKSLGLKGEKGFDEAEGDMKEAEGDLEADGDAPQGAPNEDGPPDEMGDTGKGRAVEAQGRALEALREGAQGLQRQMQGDGQGGFTATRRRPGEFGQGRDPLGRERGDGRGAMEGSLHGGADVAERARRVLQELRRRLADPNRPGDERDYLERLLKRD
ncbi:MAG: TIGR02302 family protein [Roseiarcus sp.]